MEPYGRVALIDYPGNREAGQPAPLRDFDTANRALESFGNREGASREKSEQAPFMVLLEP